MPQLLEPRFVEPMAANATAEIPEGRVWSYEIKWDGYRALALKRGKTVYLSSRNDKNLGGSFPSILEAVSNLKVATAVLDGEIVALGDDGRPNFGALQRKGTGHAIVFYAFDILFCDGTDLRELPLAQRRKKLAAVVAGSEVRLSIPLLGKAAEVAAAVRKLGLEGIVAKKTTASYQSGENHQDWLKTRFNLEQEFVIGGSSGGGTVESLQVGYYQAGRLIFAGSVRAGLNARTRALIRDQLAGCESKSCPFVNLPDSGRSGGRWGSGITAAEMSRFQWYSPRVIVQVAFLQWTDSGRLRHASFKGLRNDKSPRQVKRET